MSIGTICNRETIFAKREDTIIEAAKLMRRHHVGDVVVVKEDGEEKVPIGIVTDRDLVVEILAQETSLEAVTVGDIASFDVVTVRETDGIWDAIQTMRSKGVRRMPVINQRGGLVGIVTLDDMLELLSDELSSLAKIVNREQERERSQRK